MAAGAAQAGAQRHRVGHMDAQQRDAAGPVKPALRLAKAGGAVGPGIQAHILKRVMLAKQAAQPGQHDPLVYGLDDHVIRAGLQHVNAGLRCVFRQKRDNRDEGRGRRGAQRLDQVGAGHIRQGGPDDDQVGPHRTHHVQRITARRGLRHLKMGRRQFHLENDPVGRHCVDDHYFA